MVKRVARTVRKYSKLYLLFVKNCILAEMEYRANFWMGIGVECSWLISKLLYALVFFQSGIDIYGFSPDAMLVFIGMHTVMTGILISFFWPNFGRMTEYVRTGTLDVLITKPVSLQFIVTLRHFSFGTLIPNVIGGLVMIATGLIRLRLDIGWREIGAFAIFVALSTAISYGLFLLPNLLTFKVVEMGPINMMMSQMQEMNNVPMIVYSKWLQFAGIYLFPLFAISNIFPLFVLQQADPGMLAAAFLSPVVLLVAIRWLWGRAIRSYASASS
ncbi:ABC transporter permease [Paenibacillus sp. SYP-B4298]|uniref:ABC transporter permease n=1 Tax=Paenibacillus sp. SYP-B4298 TaxID=2996034 RepID=UPI0022DCEE82|nr:ABC-2 family transporter protein [Paenibacillus sp. SYP-B4298]